MYSKYPLELLSPAKNLEQGIAAINYGADAVYIGAPRFGAREAASNSKEDIEALIKYAHRYLAKVFLAVNTIVYEDELRDAENIARWAYEVGADALIVQDMAFLEMGLPPIPLHASTQAHNISPGKVRFLQDVGFERVILARELSLEQIDVIRKSADVELESFVHGALCVSYSGQCYMSEYVTGRSANRGACAQLCRSAYDLVDGNGKVYAKSKHLLSLKDLCLQHSIGDMAAAGISSFKIEGRLKNIDYVKNITALYRRELDRLLEEKSLRKASSGKVYFGFEPDASKSFSRGFTNYFVNKREHNLTGFNTAKATGTRIGKVTKVARDRFEIDAKLPLANGDGICFISKAGVLVGTNINKVEGRTVVPNKMDGIEPGVEIYRNYDHQFSRLLESNATCRQVDVCIEVKCSCSQFWVLATDADGFSAQLQISEHFDVAKKQDRALQTIRQQFAKSGDGIFKISDVAVDCDEVPFVPIAMLNGWRRQVLDELEQQRCASMPHGGNAIVPNGTPYIATKLDYSANVANSLARKFYERHGAAEVDAGFELEHQDEACLMTTKYCLRYELGACLKENGAKSISEPLLLENNGRRFRLHFDCRNCQMIIKKGN